MTKTKNINDNITSLSIEKYSQKNKVLKNGPPEKFITEINKNLNTLISIKDLKQSFGRGKGKKEVLRGISFDIQEGEHLSILGSNGAGKTTLVELIAGLNKPQSGTIEYKYKWEKTPLEKIGIQFQSTSYPLGISVAEVITFAINVFNCKVSKKELDGLLEIFGIKSFYKKWAHSLSGGQLQRINALLAIIHKPKIVFLDEISTGLDISIRTKIKDFIKDFAKENDMTIVLVSHDLIEVEYLAKRVIVLFEGKIVASARVDEIIKKYGSLSKFIDNYIN